MISTPDAVLQAMIKRSLQESGCPVHIGGSFFMKRFKLDKHVLLSEVLPPIQ